VIAVVAIFGGSYLPLRMPLHRQLYYQVANAWPDNLEFAERACKAQSDAELRCIVAEWNVEGDERPRLDLVTDADVAEFREKQLPVMQAIVSGEMTEDAWVDQTFDEIWGSVSFFRVLSYSVNLMTALWLILGVGSAIALAAGPPER
jgi:hypothetical protein